MDLPLKRIRQIVAAISLRHEKARKERRLELSWQTRSLAMVMAAAGASPSEELNKFAANLTIDNEEYALFNNQEKVIDKTPQKRLPVHATTQDEATAANYERAADTNSFEHMSALFGGMNIPPPG